MIHNLAPFLENNPVDASAPYRLDMGGTFDIRTFYHPQSRLKPCTVNMALGQADKIERLRPVWQDILAERSQARLLNCAIDTLGVTTET